MTREYQDGKYEHMIREGAKTRKVPLKKVLKPDLVKWNGIVSVKVSDTQIIYQKPNSDITHVLDMPEGPDMGTQLNRLSNQALISQTKVRVAALTGGFGTL